MRPVASPARQRGPAGTLPQPQAQRRAAVKSSPTGPRAARSEAVPLDRHAKRSYPPNQQPHNPQRWVEKCDRSVANSETPHPEAGSSETVADTQDPTQPTTHAFAQRTPTLTRTPCPGSLNLGL